MAIEKFRFKPTEPLCEIHSIFADQLANYINEVLVPALHALEAPEIPDPANELYCADSAPRDPVEELLDYLDSRANIIFSNRVIPADETRTPIDLLHAAAAHYEKVKAAQPKAEWPEKNIVLNTMNNCIEFIFKNNPNEFKMKINGEEILFSEDRIIRAGEEFDDFLTLANTFSEVAGYIKECYAAYRKEADNG